MSSTPIRCSSTWLGSTRRARSSPRGFARCGRAACLFVVVPDYLKERAFFWDIDYTHNFVTTDRRVRQLLYDGGFEIAATVRSIGAATGLRRDALAAGALPGQPARSRCSLAVDADRGAALPCAEEPVRRPSPSLPAGRRPDAPARRPTRSVSTGWWAARAAGRWRGRGQWVDRAPPLARGAPVRGARQAGGRPAPGPRRAARGRAGADCRAGARQPRINPDLVATDPGTDDGGDAGGGLVGGRQAQCATWPRRRGIRTPPSTGTCSGSTRSTPSRGRRTWCGWCCRSPNSGAGGAAGVSGGRRRRRTRRRGRVGRLVDALGPQGVTLQVQRLGAVACETRTEPIRMCRKRFVCDRRPRVPSGARARPDETEPPAGILSVARLHILPRGDPFVAVYGPATATCMPTTALSGSGVSPSLRPLLSCRPRGSRLFAARIPDGRSDSGFGSHAEAGIQRGIRVPRQTMETTRRGRQVLANVVHLGLPEPALRLPPWRSSARSASP